MVDRNIMRQLEGSEEEINHCLEEALGPDVLQGNLDVVVSVAIKNFSPGSVLAGTIIGRAGDDVVVEVGLKSEGLISISEFDDPSEAVPGEKVEVILETVESETGQVVLSKRKADRLRGWERL